MDSLNSDGVASLRAKIVEFFDHTLVAFGVLSQRVDDPEFTKMHGSGNSSRFRVSGDELDILDTTTLISLENVCH
jgi:hypothetical protein